MRKAQLTTGSLALATATLLALWLLAPVSEAEAQASRTRSSATARSSGESSSSASSSSSSSRTSVPRGGGAAVTRSSGRGSSSGSPTTVRGVSRHRGSSGRVYVGPRGYGGHLPYYHYGYDPYWSWSLGLGWWGGYFHSPYYRLHAPYYGSYPGYYARPHYAARVYSEPVGAFDLNVKPKKTEVWVDGRYVGTVGRFDGFPDYLWLTEGEHQLVFFLEGHVTVERQVRTIPGAVGDLRLQMEPGPSTPARQLAVESAPAPPASDRLPPSSDRGERRGAEARPPAAETPGSLDLRQEPGRLILSVSPSDASVYLDGRYLGTGEEIARLHAGLLIDSGDHRLEVVRPGYEDRVVEFSVTAGEEERVEVGLDRG